MRSPRRNRARACRTRIRPRCAASVAGVSRTRTERLVNLVICLLSTRRFLTAAQIAATVPGYEHDPNDPQGPRGVPAQVRARQGRAARSGRAAGDRHVERLRQPSPATGSPAATTRCPTSRSSRTRRPRSASRPGCGSTPAWPRRRRPAWPSCAPPASRSTRRPRSASSRWSPSTPAFGPLTAASARPAGGHVRLPGARRTTAPPPAGCSRGAWCAGAAGGTWSATTSTASAERCFRLSRIVSAVRPIGRPARTSRRQTLDLISYVARWSGPIEHTRRATAAGHARAGPPACVAGPSRSTPTDATATEVVLTLLRRPTAFAGWLVGYGSDVRGARARRRCRDAVIEPADARSRRRSPRRSRHDGTPTRGEPT